MSIKTSLKRDIIRDIYSNRMLLTSVRDRPDGWTLHSGKWSPFYIQLRLISSFPETLRKAAHAMVTLIREEIPHVNKLVGVAFAGIPIATAISLESGLPAVHTRKLTGVRTESDLKRALKEYGQHSLVEGILEDGDVLCLVDDLVTGLESKLVARAQVLAEVKTRGLNDVRCEDIAVLIDRQQGADTKAHEADLHLHSVIKFVDEGLPFLREFMNAREYDIICEYLNC
ncbi:MAG: orotate phosphoribosyltransferase [Candidatus Thorarchaeota archaeon]